MFGVDQGERHEWAAILRPRCKNRQAGEIGLVVDHFGHRATSTTPSSHAQQSHGDVPGVPEFVEARGNDGLREVHESLQELLRSPAECEFNPTRRSKNVGEHGKVRVDGILEEECGPTGSDHAPVNFR